MKLINWTPKPISLFDNMDRMVQTIFDNDFYPATAGHNWVPAVDIRENTASFTLTADIPGLNKSDIDLLVEDNRLKISGKREYNNTDGNVEYHYQEPSLKNLSTPYLSYHPYLLRHLMLIHV